MHSISLDSMDNTTIVLTLKVHLYGSSKIPDESPKSLLRPFFSKRLVFIKKKRKPTKKKRGGDL